MTYREGCGGSRRALLRLDAFGDTDVGEGQALALRCRAGSIDIKVLTDLKPKQDFQDIQDFQDFVSPSEQDLAILLYRVGRCMAAPVVRDRQIANGSRSGDLDLQNKN